MRSLAEWLAALGVLGGALWFGAPLVRSWAPGAASAVTVVESSLPEAPSGVPVTAQSVPFLILLDGTTVRLGMPEGTLDRAPFARLVAGPTQAAPGVIDSRLIRVFQSGRTRFWVVLDRTERGHQRVVTAIYVR